MTSERTEFGNEAEYIVQCHLKDLGYRILDRNWRRAWCELDLVASRDGIIHFVEVKAARTRLAGFAPTVRAGRRKMEKVKRTARTWLAARHMDSQTPWQMDIASVIMEGKGPDIEIFENI